MYVLAADVPRRLLKRSFGGKRAFVFDAAGRFQRVRDRFEGVSAFRSEGTYMMFLDCSKWLAAHGMTPAELLQKGWDYGVGWQDGSLFQAPECIRLNLASPTQRIREAFERMDRYIFNA